ncbi:MAG: sulfatase-like hydrolase/transferase [Planctomycetaceae bacterium]|nr:sulfatase-like hydrolase/transferase [Planctomycetaceae bacterium]
MRIVTVFACWFTCFFFLTGSISAADSTPRPNVVLFLIDDLGWADLGCYGSKFHRTPHLDAMAREGLRCTQFYSASPVCSPTRAAIMTGRWPARLHLTDWLPGRPDRPDQRLARPAIRQHLPLEEVTLAEALKSVGYRTGHIGKWHLGGEGFGPREQGFDINIAGDHTGSPLSYFAPFSRQGRSMPGLENAVDGEYLTDRLTTEAEKFIDAHAKEPFFLYIPHYGVHTPIRAKEELVKKYPEGPRPGVQSNPIYAAMLESVDDSVGRVLKKLAEHGLNERTVVLFTSDNGGLATIEGQNTPATNNSPLREGKGYLYEGGIRVPMLVRWPGRIPAGSTIDTPQYAVDLRPTLLAACGVATDVAMDGVDVLPVWTGTGKIERDTLYWHYPHYPNQGGKPGSAIRVGDYKLIEFFEYGRRELYDLKADPRETRNLAEAKPEIVEQLAAKLAAKLAAWRTRVDAQLPTPNPKYVPHPAAADGTITLPGKSAEIRGVQLRFEPLPHKNTLGFWTNVQDSVRWEFQLDKPGKYEVEATVGCGNGSGGSVVAFRFGKQELQMTVEATGGFQKFVPRKIGVVEFSQSGRQELIVQPLSKPGAAVMDLPQVVLRPVK